MAIGPSLVAELFLQTGENKSVVCHLPRSVESQLSLFISLARHEAAINYMVIVPGRGVARANVQLGLGQDGC